MSTTCPGCGVRLSLGFLLSRLNPYRFACPSCGAGLTWDAATRSLVESLCLGGAAVAAAVVLRRQFEISIAAALAIALCGAMGVATLIGALRSRAGRHRVRFADAQSAERARVFRCTAAIAVPCVLLLVGGAINIWAGAKLPRASFLPAQVAVLDARLASAKAGELSAEEASEIIVRHDAVMRSQDELIRSTARILSVNGWAMIVLATWALVGVWTTLRAEARRDESSARGPGTGEPPAPMPGADGRP